MTRIAGSREVGVGGILAITVAAVSVVNPAFLSGQNVADMLAGAAPGLIVACGVAFVVLTGEIDISVGSLLAFLAAIMGVLASPSHAGLPTPVVCLLVPAIGAAVGLVNGLLVTVGRVPSIIVTLGMLTALRGATEIVMGGTWITDLPAELRQIGMSRWLGLSSAVWVAAGCLLIAAWIAQRTALGRRIYATGSNIEAARLAGVRVRGVKAFAFAITGFLTGIATLVSVPQLSVVESGIGIGFELLVVTAVVVGGVSVRGGVGSITGVALAALLLAMVRTVLVFLKLGETATFWERAVHGAFILGAVVLDHVARPVGSAPPQPVESGGGRFPVWGVPAVALGVLCGVAWSVDASFVSATTQFELLPQVAETALLATAMTLIVLTGGIDLSVGSAMAFAAVVMGLAFERGAPMGIAAVMGVGAGAVCGLVNGSLVSLARVHPLIVTLATFSLFRGAAEGISGGRPISGFPEWFVDLGAERVAGVPTVVLPAIAAAAVGWFVLSRCVAGRWVRGIGFNETACRFSLVPVARVKLWLYGLSGVVAGLAAVLFAARHATAKADVGQGLELDVITAVVLGGTAVAGGRGSMVGTVLGVVFLHELRQFMAWRGVSDEVTLVIVGAVLIGAALVGSVGRGRR